MEKLKNKKCLFFLPSFTGGGAEGVIIQVANELKRQKRNIVFLISNSDGVLKGKLDKNIPLTNLNNKRLLHSFFLIKNFIESAKPDVVFTTLMHSNIIMCILKALFFRNMNLIIRESNVGGIDLSIFQNIKKNIYTLLKFFFYPYANKIIAVSNEVKKELMQLKISKNKIFVLKNPTIPRNFKALANQPITNKWILKKKIPFILSIGRLTPQKNFSFLIKLFAQLVKKINCKLVIFGEGVEKEKLLKLSKNLNIESKVKIFSFEKNPYKYMKHCKVFALTSTYEGQPNVLIEAIASGTAIVTVASPGIDFGIFNLSKKIKIVKNHNLNLFSKALMTELVNKNKNVFNEKCCKSFDVTKNSLEYEKIFYV